MQPTTFYLGCALAAASCFTTACAGDPDRYPSLAIRDVERTSGQFEIAEKGPAPGPAQRVSTPAEIAALMTQARNASAKFDTAQNRARVAVNAGRGQSADSLAYTGALLALAELSSLRSDTALALGDLDLLAIEAKTRFAPDAEIIKAQEQVISLVEEQDKALAGLWNALGA